MAVKRITESGNYTDKKLGEYFTMRTYHETNDIYLFAFGKFLASVTEKIVPKDEWRLSRERDGFKDALDNGEIFVDNVDGYDVFYYVLIDESSKLADVKLQNTIFNFYLTCSPEEYFNDIISSSYVQQLVAETNSQIDELQDMSNVLFGDRSSILTVDNVNELKYFSKYLNQFLSNLWYS